MQIQEVDGIAAEEADSDLTSAFISKMTIMPSEEKVRSYLVKEGNGLRLPDVKVEIRPLDKEKWHQKKGNDDIDKGGSFECSVVNGQYNNGLNSDEQTLLESLTGYSLTSNYNLIDIHPFYGTTIGKVKLPNNTIIFDLNVPLDYIKFKMAVSHPLVALSLEEFNAGLKPMATHYVHDEVRIEEEEIRQSSIIKKADEMFSKLSAKDKRTILTVHTTSSTISMSDEAIDAKVIMLKSQNINKFISLVEQGIPTLTNKSIIINGIAKDVINQEDGTYMYKGVALGIDLDSAAEYLNNLENQPVKTGIIEHIRNK